MTPANVPAFLDRLSGVRKSGAGWTARCPAHEDRHASLSVSVGSEGRLLAKCHAGCSFEDIVRHVGGSVRETALEPTVLGRSKASIVAEYDYRSEDGTVLYQAVRLDPKDFRQRRPDGHGGWCWDLRGVRRVLYRLPETIRAREEGRTIFLVEGEKDADNLTAIGLPATTVSGGANAQLPSDICEQLSGARVAILPDNDRAGRDFAIRVARCVRGAAASVKIVDLPGLPKNGDVSDWIGAGGSAATLEQLITDAPEFAGLDERGAGRIAPKKAPSFQVESIRLSEVQPEEVTWLWPNRVPWGKVTILEGDPGVGKSTIALTLAAYVSTGCPSWPGSQPFPPADVLIIPSFEDGTADTVVPRLLAAGADCSRVRELRGVRRHGSSQAAPLSIPDDLDALRKEILDRGARLILVDSLTSTLSSRTDSYKDMDVRKALAPLARLADELGVAVVVIRHFTKGSGRNAVSAGGGSMAIAGVARVVLQVHKAPEDETRRVLAVAKCNLGRPAPSLLFSFQDAGACASVVWEGECPYSADDLLALRNSDHGESQAPDEVETWLRETLAPRALPFHEVIALGKEVGYRRRTVQRAANRIGVGSVRQGFGAGSIWSLPAERASREPIPGDLTPTTPFAPPDPIRASRATGAELGANGLDGANGGVNLPHPGAGHGREGEWTTLML